MAKILYVGTSGSDDPTRAGLPFNFALGALGPPAGDLPGRRGRLSDEGGGDGRRHARGDATVQGDGGGRRHSARTDLRLR